jgi:hypothetical protein
MELALSRASKRDNEYLRERLQRDFPGIYADLVSKKHKTVRQASIAAGLTKRRTPMMDLRSAWRKADATERDEFLKEVLAAGSKPTGPKRAAPHVFTPALDTDRRLTALATTEVSEILKIRNISPAEAMVEIDPTRSSLDASLGMALSRRTRLTLDSSLIEAWIEDNRRILGLV